MSPKITYLDIRWGQGSVLDIAKLYPLSEAHPIRHTRGGYLMDDMKQRRRRIDLSLEQRIELQRFRTVGTLDLALTELVDPAPWQRRILDIPPRPHTIDLVPPLDTPYGALDVRRYNPIPSERLYPDIFARRLPYGLMMRRTSQETRRWTRKHRRWIIWTVLTVLLTTIPTLFFIRYSVESGYDKLLSLRWQTDVQSIRTTVASARDDFERANFLYLPFSWLPSDTLDIADRAIDGGRLLTRGLGGILSAMPTETGAVFQFARSEELSPTYRPDARDIFLLESVGIETPTDWIDENRTVLQSAFADMSRAGGAYAGVSTGSEMGDKMHTVGAILSRGMKYFSYGMEHEEELLTFLGHDEPIRYLVFNQNRDEIRANGGFPGSVIVFTLYKGNILDLRRDDIYYYDWNLYPYKEPPPPGLALLTENYGLRDVNYYPDFRLTLDKANSFIERSGDSTITSAIAIHQWLIEDLLEKTWPVSISGVTIPFDSANFSLLMSTLVENQFAREHHPKDILFQFGDALLAKIHEKRLYETVFDVFERNWRDGEILFASRDDEMDSIIADFRDELPWECGKDIRYEWWDISAETVNITSSESHSSSLITHSSNACSPNWIYPVFTSVSGNKSDRYITRRYEWKTTKLQWCTYENVVTLSLSHAYKKADTEKIRSYMDIIGIKDKAEREKLEFIEWNGKNRAFTRLYVPRSATLAFTGADITLTENEDVKVYSFMLETNPGATTSKTLRYTVDVPNCDTTDASLSWTRQPGIRELEIR